MIKRIICAILMSSLFSTCAFGEVYKVLIFRDQFFPQDRYWYMTDASGGKLYKSFTDLGYAIARDTKDGQPFRVTQYVLNYNGKYAVLSYEPKRDTERNWIFAAQTKGYLIILSRRPVEMIGSSIDCDIDFSLLPSDYYPPEIGQPYTVVVSTGN